jgi:hypothetical protein
VTSLDPLSALVELVAQRTADIVLERIGDRLASPVPAAALLDKRGIAHALGTSTASIDRYVARGVIPFVTLGPDGPRRFDLAEVRAALKGDAKPAPEAASSSVRRLTR